MNTYESDADTPAVSVVISTNGRCSSLIRTIESFRLLDYRKFEVCVVFGPTADGTAEAVEHYARRGDIKSASCPDLNLSQSRNIGIAMASGEVVAFIDDDALPEPQWLRQLVPAFVDPKVGAAGGKVFDPSGYDHQYLYAACDRLGRTQLDCDKPADRYNFPYSAVIPYVQGTNSAFPREYLVDIGGFDEEFEFYLDETDVCCRLIDRGFAIRQLRNAAVHHKFLPSRIRNEARVTFAKYAVLKNKLYFAFVNNQGHHTMDRIISEGVNFVEHERRDLLVHIEAGRAERLSLDQFEQDVERAWSVGLSRGLDGQRRTRDRSFFHPVSSFCPFPVIACEGSRRTFVFLSQGFPPQSLDGVSRYTQDISTAIARLGHTVRVLTRGAKFNRVDLEDGVWVHRIVPKEMPPLILPDGIKVPQHISDYSSTMTEEISRIDEMDPVSAVEATSWDCEGIANVIDGRIATVTNIVTSLSHWLDTHRDLAETPSWVDDFARPMLATERFLYSQSDGIIAASRAIAESVEQRYDVAFTPQQIRFLPHGLNDMRPLVRSRPAALPPRDPPSDTIKVLFVGRLELRKGIDVLLRAITLVTSRCEIEFWIAGDDNVLLEGGISARTRFEAEDATLGKGCVRFLGRVTDEELRWLYAECDFYVAPSRFESFGLIVIEAAMFEKPSVASRAGGLAEIVEDGVTGLLCEPGDERDLAKAITNLAEDPVLRLRMGRAGRAFFDRFLEVTRVARERAAFLGQFARQSITLDRLIFTIEAKKIETLAGHYGYLMPPGCEASFRTQAPAIWITFWTHPWSGVAALKIDDNVVATVDLYSEAPRPTTVRIGNPGDAAWNVRIVRTDRKSNASLSAEVIVCSVAIPFSQVV